MWTHVFGSDPENVGPGSRGITGLDLDVVNFPGAGAAAGGMDEGEGKRHRFSIGQSEIIRIDYVCSFGAGKKDVVGSGSKIGGTGTGRVLAGPPDSVTGDVIGALLIGVNAGEEVVPDVVASDGDAELAEKELVSGVVGQSEGEVETAIEGVVRSADCSGVAREAEVISGGHAGEGIAFSLDLSIGVEVVGGELGKGNARGNVLCRKLGACSLEVKYAENVGTGRQA